MRPQRVNARGERSVQELMCVAEDNVFSPSHLYIAFEALPDYRNLVPAVFDFAHPSHNQMAVVASEIVKKHWNRYLSTQLKITL